MSVLQRVLPAKPGGLQRAAHMEGTELEGTSRRHWPGQKAWVDTPRSQLCSGRARGFGGAAVLVPSSVDSAEPRLGLGGNGDPPQGLVPPPPQGLSPSACGSVLPYDPLGPKGTSSALASRHPDGALP